MTEIDHVPSSVASGGTELIGSIDLHKALGVGRAHSHWIEERIKRFGLVCDRDYREIVAGGQERRWRRVLLTPMAALRIALDERSFRGVEGADKRGLRQRCTVLQDALLEARPELEQALRYCRTSSMTEEERAKLFGGAKKWTAAVDQLIHFGFIEN